MQTNQSEQKATSVDLQEINALLLRARALLDIGIPGYQDQYTAYWNGYAKALSDLSSGVGAKLVAKDAASGGYVQGGGNAAWARLAIGLESLTAVEIVERFAAQGIEMSADSAAQLRLETVQQLPHGVVTTVELDDKHTASHIDMGNGACLHSASLVVFGVDIVADGCNMQAATFPSLLAGKE
ncbi:MAG: hypothetical protein Q8R67_08095 [Rhodoferax sp.]|nr:hypothetical protein [Rhodoferax sp.]MDP3651629.1 hypothetical protein [Rhodoferax sp.]